VECRSREIDRVKVETLGFDLKCLGLGTKLEFDCQVHGLVTIGLLLLPSKI